MSNVVIAFIAFWKMTECSSEIVCCVYTAVKNEYIFQLNNTCEYQDHCNILIKTINCICTYVMYQQRNATDKLRPDARLLSCFNLSSSYIHLTTVNIWLGDFVAITPL